MTPPLPIPLHDNESLIAHYLMKPGHGLVPAELILCRIAGVPEWAVWTRNMKTGDCFAGYYAVNFREALRNFIMRVERDGRE